MTVLQAAKKYYQTNSQDLNSFLETTTFLDPSTQYPVSVVIKFESEKIIGEVSVWGFGNDSYLEYEYVNLMKPLTDPIYGMTIVNENTLPKELTTLFAILRKLVSQ